MSTDISRSKKNISSEYPGVDALGKVLHQRVVDLLAARPDLSRPEFGRRIRRGHSWISEFFAELRTTNDLRLVTKISRVFGVSVGYLLGETTRPLDPGAATLLATWDALEKRDRDLLLTVAASFRQRAQPSSDPATAPSTDDANGSRARMPPTDDEPPKRKRSQEAR